MHVPNYANITRPCITLNSSICVYWNETKLCTQVARGKILTVTEHFSNLTATTLAMTSLMAKNQTCKLAVLKNNILSLYWDCSE